MTAREDILARIRRSTATAAGDRQSEYSAIPRHYLQQGQRDRTACLDLFTDRLLDYGCGVHGCASHEIAASVAHILGEREKRESLVAPDVPGEWLPSGFEFVRSPEALFKVDSVITRCALAIAATGTIVLRGIRALTLVPDYHLCCIFEDQVVELVPEAIRQMNTFSASPITTVSGPSATSDIEMTRIQGVHGPRTLDVLMIGAEQS